MASRYFQGKSEAYWFYRFLSIFYDYVTVLGGWTVDVRDAALEPADLSSPSLKVVEIGAGTGYSTIGIVKHIDPKNVTMLDQSPHQLAHARKKKELKDCTIIEGDAEDLPFPTDYADRYVSCESIQYWPETQKGVNEAYRVLKPGGRACIVGPVHPTTWISRVMAGMWMLFPKEEEYIQWFKNAGFEDVQLKRVGPKWYRGVRRHGLVVGCSVTGVKRTSGASTYQVKMKKESKETGGSLIGCMFRFVMAYVGALYFTLLPVYMAFKNVLLPKGMSL